VIASQAHHANIPGSSLAVRTPHRVTLREIADYEEFMGLPGIGQKFIDAGLWIVDEVPGQPAARRCSDGIAAQCH
jgi:hypothetical protein